MTRYILRILCCMLPLLTMASCDYDAHLVEYEDVLGTYKGIGTACITIGADEGLDWPGMGHFNYGDTLLQTITSPDSITMYAEVDTDNIMSFLTSVPQIHILGRELSIDLLYVEKVNTIIKGNHVVSWDTYEIPTQSTVLPLKTLYVPIKDIEIMFTDENNELHEILAQGYLAASLVNYSLYMDLMIEEAPELLTPGCTLWMTYHGVMNSKKTYKKEDL